MDTRRSFLKKAGLLSAGTGLLNILPPSIQKAMAINPNVGSTFLDAEHIVFLMQENRSFDHTFGTLQGVRGFNDPRAITQPNNNKVWLQTNKAGETYTPFRLDMKDTKSTWMGNLPHSWTNQVDARNNGHYDKWLDAKRSGSERYFGMPLTMGYYDRQDIPFYYSLADAFTICDHNFCSSLTGTTPNRLFFWSGTIRSEQTAAAKACVWNEDAEPGSYVSWKTYPERLEEHGISWKIYQNEIYEDVGLGAGQGWLDNFGDNPLEYFTQYHIKLSPEYIAWLPQKEALLNKQMAEIQVKLAKDGMPEKDKLALEKELEDKKQYLAEAIKEKSIYTKEKFDSLPEQEKNIHRKAFTNNRNDPHFHEMTSMKYMDGTVEREISIPKGDVLHQFRADVNSGNLPTVSWIAAPEQFSDHPCTAWFGAWYMSEVMDILTKNPEVWKKTIFVLTYDENDGFFDHVAPFTAPNPYQENTGKVSPGIDPSVEYVTKEQQSFPKSARESSIGLGYRVPMIIASPWSRGGFVCSEVFDHTSSLQFLETFLEKKTGKKIQETNISEWRRTICGDLTSAFRPYHGEKITKPKFLDKTELIQTINNARYKKLPDGFKKLSVEQIAEVNSIGSLSEFMPKQEKGTRSASPLPYELYVDGNINSEKNTFEIDLRSSNLVFGSKALGCPFYIYSINKYNGQLLRSWNYAIKAGGEEKDKWSISDFENNAYHLTVHGPNGFFRMFKGDSNDPQVVAHCMYETEKNNATKLTGNLLISIQNKSAKSISIEVVDNSYKASTIKKSITANSISSIKVNLGKNVGWYDVSVKTANNQIFEKRFAGKVETGSITTTDPFMGGIV